MNSALKHNTALTLALDWLARSNLYHTEPNSPAQGGVNQGYNWQARSYPFVYSEITGYAISMFVNAHGWQLGDDYLTLARQSARFVTRIQREAEADQLSGALPHGLTLPSLAVRRQYYSFDAAMCLQGLLDLQRLEPSDEWLNAARGIGDWLLTRMQQPEGSFLAMYDAPTRTERHPEDTLFGDGGCLHAKHAIGLLKLSQATHEPRYAEAARRVCDWVLRLQDADGAFWSSAPRQQVVSHTHCYATEGLLFAYYVLGDERYREAAARAGRWLLKAQNADGSISIVYKKPWWRMGRRLPEILFPRRVTDATPQAIRIWLSLYYLEGDTRFLTACRQAQRFVERMQCVSGADANAIGGFYYWPGHPMMFAWCGMFAAHALFALEHYQRPNGYQHLLTELF
jgi:uncharacterized protein YyaL (SSP411 family)